MPFCVKTVIFCVKTVNHWDLNQKHSFLIKFFLEKGKKINTFQALITFGNKKKVELVCI